MWIVNHYYREYSQQNRRDAPWILLAFWAEKWWVWEGEAALRTMREKLG